MATDSLQKLTFLASYPKSGNTWVRLLISQYFLDKDHGYLQGIDTQWYAHQTVSPVCLDELSRQQVVQLRNAALMHIQHSPPDQQPLIKTHNACIDIEGVPLFSHVFTDRVVHIVRDPRDVVCSVANHVGATLEKAVDQILDPGMMIGGNDNQTTHFISSWNEHTSSWVETDRVPIQSFRYEDLQDDTAGTFIQILRWLGEDEIDEDAVDRAIEETRFDKLKETEQEEGFEETPDSSEEGFFRKGESGGWKEELPITMARRVRDECIMMMEHFDYIEER